MRLLLLPILERAEDPQGDSTFLWFADLARQASNRGWHSYLMLPKATVYEHTERVTDLRYQTSTVASRAVSSMQVVGFVSNLLNAGPDSLMVDAVVTSDALAGHLLSMYLGNQFGRIMPPVFVLAASVVSPGSVEVKDESLSYVASHAMGAATMYLIVPTEPMLQRVVDSLRSLTTGAFFGDASRRVQVISCGPDCATLDEVKQTKFDRFSLYFGGRFTASKGGEQVVRDYIRFVEGARDADVHVTAVGAARRLHDVVRREGGQEVVQVASGLAAREAWALMSRCHASMFRQTLEMLPATPYEQLYCGLSVVFKNHGKERELLPPNYPFLAETDLEMNTMLRWIYDNRDNVNGNRELWPWWVKTNLDRMRGFDKLLDQVERVAGLQAWTERRGYRWSDDAVEAMRGVLSAIGGAVLWADAVKGLARAKPALFWQNEQRYSRGHPLLTVYRCFMPDGWVDNGLAAEPVFKEVSSASAE